MDSTHDELHGGFLLSPPASSIASPLRSDRQTLPLPRDVPLRSGGSKESTFIRFVDQKMLHIQRRFAKRTTPASALLSEMDREKADSWGDVKGYSSMKEAFTELEDLVNVVWISGTPGLQIPYLITIGMQAYNIIQAMPPSHPRSLFHMLDKLDHAYTSLLQGRDSETGRDLPGLGQGKAVSGTEKVRIRSLVERTRVSVVEAFKRGEFEHNNIETGGDDAESDDHMSVDDADDDDLVIEGADDLVDEEEATIDMQIARVYDRTIVELGDSLETPSIGIITEGRRC
jgi:hypothetical protein